MKTLSGKRLGVALRAWRKANNWSEKDVAEASKEHSGTPVAQATISQLETRGKGFAFDRLFTDILPAYGISDFGDFDLFLDFYPKHSLESIAIVRRKDLDIRNFNGTKEIMIPPEMLGNNRARISIIQLEPGKTTLWQNHRGHEYLMISKGSVTAEFAEKNAGPRKIYNLKKGDGVAFPSALFHRFSNHGTKKAELTIARPTKSLPLWKSAK